MANQELFAQLRMIVAAEGSPTCFAELKRKFAGRTLGTLGVKHWSTMAGYTQVGYMFESLRTAPISNRLPSARSTSKKTLRSDLLEIFESHDLSDKRGFEHLAKFMDTVILCNDSEVAPWEHLYTYLRIRFQTTTNTDENDDIIRLQIHSLHQQWSSTYLGEAMEALKDKLKSYHLRFKRNDSLYARIMPIVQSSGTGKSRLVNELGGSVLGISFTLREKASSGYPPGDPEVVRFLKEGVGLDVASQQAMTICFLGAAISTGM